ncbi:hypothetical protein HK097_001738 [Rhizophlyctis rosea]|uniref:Uncharacterized protein n=1 Tax=Rhizophlyctis rosea TaxID=64517 RepID=A0AAD5S5L4_9FUNG|nr:hypothetical protein HK097_001738 [Rhizophlyctis rosea]
MNSQLLNLGLVFGIMQVANKFNLDRPENTTYLRASYLIVQIITAAIALFIQQKIKAKNDTTPLTYSEQKNPFDKENVEQHKTTFRDYDLSKIKEGFTQQAVGVAIIALMHLKWGYTRPLLLQSILGLRTVTQTPLFKIYILGKPASGELARPWTKGGLTGAPAAAPTQKELKAKERKEQKKKISHVE